MVVDVDMPDSVSIVDFVLKLEEEHCNQNLLLLDLASKQGRSGSRALSEEHCSSMLTEHGTVPTEAEAQADVEDVAVNEGVEMLHREASMEALSNPQALQDAVEDVVSEPHSASPGNQVASSEKPVAPESGKIAVADASDSYCFSIE